MRILCLLYWPVPHARYPVQGGQCGQLHLYFDHGFDLVAVKANRFGLAGILQHGDVVQLVNCVLKTEPFDGAARIDVDHQKATAGRCVFLLQQFLQLQSLKRLVFAGAR
jgi:hypothetical protein